MVSAAGQSRLVVSMGRLQVVSRKPMLEVSIDEVMAHKTTAQSSTEKGVVMQSTADRLLLVSTFKDSFVRGRDFSIVDCCLKTFSATTMAKLQLLQALMDNSLYQVSIGRVYCVLLL